MRRCVRALPRTPGQVLKVSCAGALGIAGLMVACGDTDPAAPVAATIDATADVLDATPAEATAETGANDAGADVSLAEPCGDPAIRLVGTILPLRERTGALSLRVSLSARPRAQVTVALGAQPGRVSFTPAQFTFGPETWSVAQELRITGTDDGVIDPASAVQVRATSTSSDVCFDKLTTPLALTVADDNAVAVLANVPAFNRTTWAGGSVAIAVRLGSKPLSAVTIPVALTDTLEASVDKASLTFSPQDFATPQTVVVTGKPSSKALYKNAFSLTLGPTSGGDAAYVGLSRQVALENVNPDAVDQLGSSSRASCAVFANGRIKCWGDGSLGLQNNSVAAVGTAPGQMGSNLPFLDFGSGFLVRQVVLGFEGACAVAYDGRVKCLSGVQSSTYGSMGTSLQRPGGYGNSMGNTLPLVALGDTPVASLGAAGFRSGHFCAVLTTGALKCWGNNATGQLGLGDTMMRGQLPGTMGAVLPVVDLGVGRTVRSVAVGGDNTCAVLDNERIKCWGANTSGRLGLGDSVARGTSASQMGDALPYVDLGTNVRASNVCVGESHACALLDGGRLKCWGTGGYLGLGDAVARGSSPAHMGDALPFVDLGPGRTAKEVSCGLADTCALLDDATVRCWGPAVYSWGEQGAGNNAARGNAPGQMGAALPPVDLGAGPKPHALALGSGHGVIREDGSTKMWGYGRGLGLGDFQNRGDGPGEMGAALPSVPLLSP
jgi:hypothetical protein